MKTQPAALSLVVALLLAAPALSAPTHSGTWTAQVKETKLQLSFHRRGEHGGQIGMSLPLATFEGLSTADGNSAPFRMVRQAGTFLFEGRFASGLGAGLFRFEPDASYAQAMAAQGYPKLTAEEQYKLALFDITPARVKELAALGFKDLPLEKLLEAGIFDVTADYVRSLAALGYTKLSLQELIDCRIHGVRPEFIQEVRAMGYPDATVDELVQLRIHGIDGDFVRSLTGGKGGGGTRGKK